MKTKFAYSIVTAVLMFFSVSTFAQKSVASISTSTASKMIDEKTAVVTFQVSNIANDAAKQKMADTFKACQPVMSVNAALQGTTATYNVTMPKQGRAHTIQDMLVKAGVETITVDGKTVESKNFVQYSQDSKKARQTK